MSVVWDYRWRSTRLKISISRENHSDIISIAQLYFVLSSVEVSPNGGRWCSNIRGPMFSGALIERECAGPPSNEGTSCVGRLLVTLRSIITVAVWLK